MNAMQNVPAKPGRSVLDRAVSRARWRLLPFMLLMYLLAYLDRSNIGYAKQAYQAASGVSDAAFAFGAGIFFITYALFEIPSNLLLHRFGARRWMARIMVTWGIISACMIFAHGDTSFSIVRLLLGAAEAGFFPGAILYMTYWFPAEARGRVLAIFYFGGPLALMFGGPISGLLLDLDGAFGLAGWQLMYLVEGLLAAAVGVITFFYLTDRPQEAAWMPADEREALIAALAAETQERATHGTTGLAKALRDPYLLQFALIYFLIQISGYGVAFYLPTQVSALIGVKVGLLVGFVTAIPWAFAILVGIFCPALAVRRNQRRLFAFTALAGIVVGLVIAANTPPVVAIAGMCLVTAGIITAQPIFWTFPTAYLGGLAAAGGFAAINAIGNLGGFVAPILKTAMEAHFHSSAAGLYTLAGAPLIASLLILMVRDRRSVAAKDISARPIDVPT